MGNAQGSSGPVVARFRLTPGEYGEGMREIMRRQPSAWFGPVAGAGTFVAGVAMMQVVAIVAGVVLLLFAGAAWYYAPAKSWKHSTALHDDQEHTFTSTGVSVRAGKERGHLPWDFYRSARETKNVYVLFRSAKSGNFVPKSAFATSEEEGRFRAMLSEHLDTSWTS